MKKFGNFNILALVIGFSFLYIPIILLSYLALMSHAWLLSGVDFLQSGMAN